jgi:hypothetical protein
VGLGRYLLPEGPHRGGDRSRLLRGAPERSRLTRGAPGSPPGASRAWLPDSSISDAVGIPSVCFLPFAGPRSEAREVGRHVRHPERPPYGGLDVLDYLQRSGATTEGVARQGLCLRERAGSVGIRRVCGSAPGGNRTRGLRLESATSVSRDVRDVAAFRAVGLLPMPFAMQFGAALIDNPDRSSAARTFRRRDRPARTRYAPSDRSSGNAVARRASTDAPALRPVQPREWQPPLRSQSRANRQYWRPRNCPALGCHAWT